MLQYWIDNTEPAASWEKIILALQRIGGHKSIITSIQLKYIVSSRPQDHDHVEPLSTSDEIISQSQPRIAEVSVSLGRVSARPIHSLTEQLSKFPVQLLDSPCINSHLIVSGTLHATNASRGEGDSHSRPPSHSCQTMH
jgi:hypothetical protein